MILYVQIIVCKLLFFLTIVFLNIQKSCLFQVSLLQSIYVYALLDNNIKSVYHTFDVIYNIRIVYQIRIIVYIKCHCTLRIHIRHYEIYVHIKIQGFKVHISVYCILYRSFYLYIYLCCILYTLKQVFINPFKSFLGFHLQPKF